MHCEIVLFSCFLGFCYGLPSISLAYIYIYICARGFESFGPYGPRWLRGHWALELANTRKLEESARSALALANTRKIIESVPLASGKCKTTRRIHSVRLGARTRKHEKTRGIGSAGLRQRPENSGIGSARLSLSNWIGWSRLGLHPHIAKKKQDKISWD